MYDSHSRKESFYLQSKVRGSGGCSLLQPPSHAALGAQIFRAYQRYGQEFGKEVDEEAGKAAGYERQTGGRGFAAGGVDQVAGGDERTER